MRIGWMGASCAVLVALAACGKKSEPTPAANAAAPAEGAAAPAAAQGPAAAPVTAPRRKAGLWEQKTSFGQMVQTTSICLDPAVDEKLGFAGKPADNPCSENKVVPHPGGGWEFSSVCDMGEGGKMTSKGVATGDFAAKYRVDVESTTTGAAAPQMNGVHRFALEAEWKGPCPAGMKPGDVKLPNGMTVSTMGTK